MIKSYIMVQSLFKDKVQENIISYGDPKDIEVFKADDIRKLLNDRIEHNKIKQKHNDKNVETWWLYEHKIKEDEYILKQLAGE